MYSLLWEPQYNWLVIIITFIIQWIPYMGFRYNQPYYSDYMNRLWCVCISMFIWGNCILVILTLLINTTFDGGLQIYFLGLPLVGLMEAYRKDDRVALLNKNINSFQRGEEVALQIRYYLNLVMTRDTDRRNAIILRGYIYHHEDQCSYSECCLGQYKRLMKMSINQKNKSSSKTGSNENKPGIAQDTPGAKSHKNEL